MAGYRLRYVTTIPLLLCFLSNTTIGQDEDDPFKSSQALPAGVEWNAADGGQSSAIKVTYRNGFTSGEPGCPILIIGNDVRDVETLRIKTQLEGTYDSQGLRALSLDGNWFAASSKSPNQTETTISVWSTNDGKKRFDVTGGAEEYWDYVAFSRNTYLVLGGRHKNELEIWEIAKGEKLPKSIPIPVTQTSNEPKIDFTLDAKMFASLQHDRVTLTATANGRELFALDGPGTVRHEGDDEKEKPAPDQIRTLALQNSMFYARASGLKFSPDGEELAMYSAHPHPRLLIWNRKGRLLVDDPLPYTAGLSTRAFIQWTPEGNALFVNGHLIDRGTRQILLRVNSSMNGPIVPTLLNQNQIAFGANDFHDHMKIVTIPWDQLIASQKLIKSKAPAKLTPNKPLSIQVETTAEDVRRALTEILTERLATAGLRVQPDQKTILSVQMSESKGATLPIVEKDTPFDRRGRETGQKATESKGSAVLEIRVEGSDKPLWRGQLNAISGRSFKDEINDKTLRDSMLRNITQQIRTLDIPYFIPESAGAATLPLLIE